VTECAADALARPPAPPPEDVGERWEAAMRAGDFAAAWRASDASLAARDPATRDDPRLPYHLRWVWDGRPFDECHVLVRCYHGLGDTLQFARFLPELRRRARRVTLECQPALAALLAAMADAVVPFRPDAPMPPAECDIEIMELAHALRISQATLAAPFPYLTASARRTFPHPAIGLCWQAGDWDSRRSVPLPLLAAALDAPGRRFVSLQRGAGAVAAGRPGAAKLFHADECPETVETSDSVGATAALIGGLDLVVTVDTMVAHLAGALGARVALLLQAEADWRWMTDRGETPWYPGMRLYRQARAGDWAAPLAGLAEDLRAGRLGVPIC